jgi:class 3 adenylate cyclase/tetratricopeptide (TPR) repeat protein
VELGFRFCPDCGQALASGDESSAARPASPVPDDLARKIRDAQSLPGERKQVTVLFCDLAGSTAVAGGLDPEVYREVLDQYVALAMHEVYRFEGIVNQISGDGFMALFGAPVAHEDAPQRAVLAALAIRDALAHFNQQLQRERGVALPARIGLNTGPVVVGTVGNDLKMDYTAIGDTTNLAARLEQMAQPGTILISEVTARLVRGLASLRQVGPLVVKGKAEPIAAYEVLSAEEQTNPMTVAAERGMTPFVGRDEELAQLESCFRRVSGRYTQVVAVSGNAGGGKSRLIWEFKQQMADGTAPVYFEGRCAALSQSVPLAPFVAMLRQYFDLSPRDDESQAHDKVAARLGAAAAEKVDAAFPLLCRVLSEPVLPAHLPLEPLKQELFEAINKLVHAESRQAPVVMILEDLHWIDESSQELLDMAIARLSRAPVMILVSHRPEYRPVWRTEAAVTQVYLRPLLEADVLRIERALAGGALPDELEARILAKAEGSPFFVEEITRSLIEEGFLSSDDGRVRLTRSVEEILIPGSVREVIAARLDRLPPPAKRVAQLAAVLGRQFHRHQLAELLADEQIEVNEALDELRRRGVIHRKSLFSDNEYRFGESLTQEVAYDSLLHRQRRQLHGRVATLLEGGGDPALARSGLVAHHLARSDDRQRAVEALLRAAGDAEQLPSFRTALDLYRQAWETGEVLLGDAPADRRFQTWVMQAALGFTRVTVLYGSSADPDAERAALRGRQLAVELGAKEAAGTLHTMHGMLLTVDPERFAEGIAITEAAVAEARQSGDMMLALSASRAVAWHYLLDGRFMAARTTIEWVERGLEERSRETPIAAEMHLVTRHMHDGILQASDELELAFARSNETLVRGEELDNHTVQAGSNVLLAQIHLQRTQYAEARTRAARGLELAERIGNVAALQRARGLLLAARVALGETLSIGALGDVLEQGIERGGTAILSVQPVVDACIALGDLRRAERIARLAFDRAAGRYREVMAAAALGEVLVRLGPSSWAEADRTIDRALAIAEAIGARSLQAQLLVSSARLALERDLPHDARQALERARTLCAEIGLLRFAGSIPMLVAQAESNSRASA